jgi:hypothetical protein
MVKKIMTHNLYINGLKTRTTDSLRFSLIDAQEAVNAFPDGINAGFYMDEVHYIAAELRTRQA